LSFEIVESSRFSELLTNRTLKLYPTNNFRSTRETFSEPTGPHSTNTGMLLQCYLLFIVKSKMASISAHILTPDSTRTMLKHLILINLAE
jgi:hypothetical protein